MPPCQCRTRPEHNCTAPPPRSLLSSTVFITIGPDHACNTRAQNRAWRTTVTWLKRMLPGHLIPSPLKSPSQWLGALNAPHSSPVSVTAYSAATRMLDGPRTENLPWPCDGWTSLSHNPSLPDADGTTSKRRPGYLQQSFSSSNVHVTRSQNLLNADRFSRWKAGQRLCASRKPPSDMARREADFEQQSVHSTLVSNRIELTRFNTV